MTYQTKHPPRLRFISAVLSLAMLLTLLPVTAFAADRTEIVNGVQYYQMNGIEVWWITGTYTGNATSLTLENRIDGQDVNCIHGAVFKNNQTLTKVTLPTNVRFYEIGDEAFAGCTNLESPDFSKWLCRIGEKAFQNCTNLKSIVWNGQSWVTAEASAFAGCIGLESVTMSGTPVTLEDNAFEGCTSLKSVTLSGSSVKIGNNVFKDCTNLEEITLPKEINTFGKNVFDGCTNLKKITYKGKSTEWETCPAKDKIPANVTVEFAEPLTEYGISVRGIKVNEANYSDVLGDNKVEFRPDSNFLKLSNVNWSCNDANAVIDSTLDQLTIAGNGDDTIINTSGPAIQTTGTLILDSSHIVLQGKPAISAQTIRVDESDCWYRTASGEPYAKYTESVDIRNTNYIEIIHSRYNPNGPGETGIALWIDGIRMPKIEGGYDVFDDDKVLLEEYDYGERGGMHCTLYLKDASLESDDTAIIAMVDQLTMTGSGTIKGGKNSICTENTGTVYGAEVSIDEANLTFTGGLDLEAGASITNSTVKINGWTEYGIKAGSNLIINGSDVTIASETGEYALCPQIVQMYGNSTLRLQGAKSIANGGDQRCIIYTKYWYRTSPDGEYTEGTEEIFKLNPSYTYYELTTKDPYAVTTYDLWVAGEQVTETNQNDVLEDGGSVKFDPDTNTLTLEDAEIHGDSADHQAIRYTVGYGSLTVKGSATLYGDVGIDSQGDLNIENADLTFRTEVTADNLGSAGTSSGFMSYSAMTIRNSTLKIESAVASGQGYCVYPYFCQGDLRIENNSTVSVDDNVRCDYGLSAQETLTISDSRVTIPNARVQGIASEGNMTLSGADTWVVAENAAEGSQYVPIWCKNSIDLQNGLEILENTTQNGVKRMVVGNRANQVFAVVFAMNGHGTQEPAQQVKYGMPPKAPARPEAEGWYFVGWYADEACTEAAAFGLPIQKETTFYAKWVEKTNQQPYQVHFDLNASDARWEQNFGGWGKWDDAHRVVTAETHSAYDNTTERLIQRINMEPVLGYAQPEREGYTFKGWYTAPEGGEKMEEKYDVSMGVMGDITEDLTFYAQWEKIGGEPSNPDKPTEPSNPDKPTEPSNPDKPTEPSNPDKPTEPSNPDKPTEPSNPDKPTEPSNPEKPTTPEEPEQPTTPSEPSKDGGGAGAVILLAGGAVILGTGVAAVGVAAYGIGTELAAWLMLPAGAGMPTTRGELAVVLWKQAGCPAIPMEAPLSETEIALRWAIDHRLAGEDTAPEESVSTTEVFKALKKAKDI